MTEKALVIEPGFSTADSQFPTISTVQGELVLAFIDWEERPVKVQFNGTVSYKWQVIETFVEGEYFDRSHEILNSEWILEHIRQNEIESDDGCKHYKFNFNGSGQLEIICTGFSVSV